MSRPPHGTDAADGGGHPGGMDYGDRPLVVTWETSQACALACDHCRADANPRRHPDELTTDEAVELIEQVGSFGERPPFFVLSGGDPLERPDLFELLEAAVDRGVSPAVTPATTPKLDEATLERFAEIGVRRIAVSIDGASATRHDAFRGEPGTFETAIEAAEYARELGVGVQFNTTVTASTVDDLPGIAALADRIGVAMWEVFFLVPIGRGARLDQLTPAQAKETARWLYDHARESPYRVITVEAPFYRVVAGEQQQARGEQPSPVGTTGAGRGFVFVSHTGEVYPSGFLPLSGGNVRETPLPEIYRDAALFRALRDPDALSGPCGSCRHRARCGGSRSRAYAATGDPLATDPLCPYAHA